MSKEIDWNTVETVWDYKDSFKEGEAEYYDGSKENYIKETKSCRTPDYSRLCDLSAFLFSRNNEKEQKRIKEELEKNPDYIKDKEEEEYLAKNNLC